MSEDATNSRPDVVQDVYLEYLNEQREAGTLNLRVAAGYLQDGFGLSPEAVHTVLNYWVDSLNESSPAPSPEAAAYQAASASVLQSLANLQTQMNLLQQASETEREALSVAFIVGGAEVADKLQQCTERGALIAAWQKKLAALQALLTEGELAPEHQA